MTTDTDQTTYAGNLTIVMCWCGIRLGIPAELDTHRRREHDAGRQFSVHCPLGHRFVPAGPSAKERLEQRLADARESEQWYREQYAAERRRAAAARGQLTKLRKRVANGLCPQAGCKRSFTSLHDHVADCHPDLAALLDETTP